MLTIFAYLPFVIIALLVLVLAAALVFAFITDESFRTTVIVVAAFFGFIAWMYWAAKYLQF